MDGRKQPIRGLWERNGRFYAQLKIEDSLTGEKRPAASRWWIPDGYKFHGQTVHYPALVLLDPNGREVFRYVGKNNTDRIPYEKFSAKLEKLTR